MDESSKGMWLYLGELNGRREVAWRKTAQLLGGDDESPCQTALFPEAYAPDAVRVDEVPVVKIKLSEMSLRRPRQWGDCRLGCQLWEQLGLSLLWREARPPGREGTKWDQVLQTLVLYRLIDSGSEWRPHRHWFDHTAIAGLLGGDSWEVPKIQMTFFAKLWHDKAFMFDSPPNERLVFQSNIPRKLRHVGVLHKAEF